MRKLRVVTDDDLSLLEDATGSTATIINVASREPFLQFIFFFSYKKILN
jgi:hypothetical protein